MVSPYRKKGTQLDLEEETAKFKRMLYVGVLFLFSLIYSWKELKYLAFGTTVDATIDKVEEMTSRSRRSGEHKYLVVRYHFTDKDGLKREGRDQVDAMEDVPRKGTVPVRYLSGDEGDTRLASQSNFVAPVIFLVMLGIMVYFVVSIWREGTADTRRARKLAQRR